jgi:hypothetical protein
MPLVKSSKKRKQYVISENRNKRYKKTINFDEIIEKLKNQKGRIRSSEENKLIIQSLCYFQKNNMSLDEACKECEIMFKGSHNTYRSLWNYYMETGDLNISETHELRGIKPHKINDILDMNEEEIDKLLLFAFEYTVYNHTGFSIADLKCYLNAEHGIVINTTTLYYILNEFDFHWTSQSQYYGTQYFIDRKLELKRFYYQYSNALQLQNDGSHLIVPTDESWANTHTSFENAWVHNCESEDVENCYVCKKFVEWSDGNDCKSSISKPNSGKRCVFMHGFTIDGLLVVKDNDEFIKPDFEDLANLNSQLPTAEYIFECKNGDSKDYHDQMDFDKYSKWFENRLIHSFQQIYGNRKKAIYFVDQAKFHVKYVGFPLSNATKDEIIEYYDKYKITEVNVIRNESNLVNTVLKFARQSFSKKKRSYNPLEGGPSKDELYYYLYFYLKKHNPQALEPSISQIAKKYGHIVLFGCTNNHQDQPAEFLNAHVKLMVKRKCCKDRSIDQLKKDIRDGMYGGITKSKKQHKPVDSHIIQGWFKKCHANMNENIKTILGIENKNIENLWDAKSEISLTDTFFRLGKTKKTLKNVSSKFTVILDNIPQNLL